MGVRDAARVSYPFSLIVTAVFNGISAYVFILTWHF